MRFPVIQLALAAAVAGARDLLGEIQSTASALEPRAQPATAPRIDLKQAESNLTYLASVEIGEPGQAIDLEVSTSADWTWVPAKDDTGCDGGACTHGTCKDAPDMTFSTGESALLPTLGRRVAADAADSCVGYQTT